MNGEPATDPVQTVNQALLGQFFIWLGLVIGLITMSIVLVCISLFAPVPPPFPDSPEIGYGFLLIVPLGLLGAYFAGSIIPMGNPAETTRRSSDPSGSAAWDEITEKDLADWCAAFQSGLMIRLSLLEGPGIICAIGFFVIRSYLRRRQKSRLRPNRENDAIPRLGI